MITSLANHIADFIHSNTDISKEHRDIYVYGYEIIISTVITFVLLIVTGAVFGRLAEAVAFYAAFYLLREQTGGYHADTYFKCNLIFEINIISVMLLTLIDFPFKISVAVNVVSFVFCFGAVLLLAPIENKNKPLDSQKRKTHKIMGLIFTVVFEIISICLLNYIKLSFCISMAMASTAFAMIINPNERSKKI